jgi:hypothetical protein
MPRSVFTGLFLAMLVLPVFFSVQILLVLAGRPDLTLAPAEAEFLFRQTPAISLVAPVLRLVTVTGALVAFHHAPRWLAQFVFADIAIHLVGWVFVAQNYAFDAPTGYVSVALQAVTLYLLIQSGHIRFGPPERTTPPARSTGRAPASRRHISPASRYASGSAGVSRRGR